MDLNGQVCVRARAADQKQTIELVLDCSQATGQSLRFALNRALLGRAIALGLSDLCVQGAEKPLLFQNAQRLFVAVPLDKNNALPACEEAIRIHSAQEAKGQETKTQRRIPAMNGEIPNHADTSSRYPSLRKVRIVLSR